MLQRAAEIEWEPAIEHSGVSNRGADELVKFDVGPSSELAVSTRRGTRLPSPFLLV